MDAQYTCKISTSYLESLLENTCAKLGTFFFGPPGIYSWLGSLQGFCNDSRAVANYQGRCIQTGRSAAAYLGGGGGIGTCPPPWAPKAPS